jgi:hypothetical protein
MKNDNITCSMAVIATNVEGRRIWDWRRAIIYSDSIETPPVSG